MNENEVEKAECPQLPSDYEQLGLTAVTVYIPIGREREIEHAALQLRNKDGVYLPNDLIF
jgi:hypothetical protein